MGRIIFLCAFSKTEVTGGIKTMYRHAEILRECGIEALVFQPEGRPAWFESTAPLVDPTAFKSQAGDVLVFSESLSGQLGEMARAPTVGKKILFCQNQYYLTTYAIAAEPRFAQRFAAAAAPSTIAKNFLENVLHFENVAVIAPPVDTALFSPGIKTLEIAYVPHKMPREARLIQTIFHFKYPELKSVPWTAIEKKSERETAAILSRAAMFLSLGFLESLGLVALEAMAAGAIVTGFNGYGGREFATAENGFWFSPEQLEETANTLARVIKGLEKNDPQLAAMRDAGGRTAQRFNKADIGRALSNFYGHLLGQP